MFRSIHATARYGLGLVWFVMPSVCCANGWVSGVNAFRQTPEFYVIFTAIVIVEWAILWFCFRPLGSLGSFWRVLLVNTISSLAGDLLFRLGWASPGLAANADRLIFRSGSDTLGLINVSSNTLTTVMVGRTANYLEPVVSPDARFAVVPLALNPIPGYGSYLTIVNLNDPSQRYYLGHILYRVVWARTETL
jgi:hypothetical protein